MISALTVNPSQSTSPIYLLPRFPSSSSSSSRDWTVPIQAPSQLWFLHVANSFEENSNDVEGSFDIYIQAAACSYQWFNFRNLFGMKLSAHVCVFSLFFSLLLPNRKYFVLINKTEDTFIVMFIRIQLATSKA